MSVTWLRDFAVDHPVGADNITGLVDTLTHDWGLTDVRILSVTEPLDQGDHYLIHDVEVEFSAGYTAALGRHHGTLHQNVAGQYSVFTVAGNRLPIGFVDILDSEHTHTTYANLYGPERAFVVRDGQVAVNDPSQVLIETFERMT